MCWVRGEGADDDGHGCGLVVVDGQRSAFVFRITASNCGGGGLAAVVVGHGSGCGVMAMVMP